MAWKLWDGRRTNKAKAAKRGPGARVGYTYLHTAIDGFSRPAYTEAAEDEKAVATSTSVPTRPGTTGRSNATTGYRSMKCSTPAPTPANTPAAPPWAYGSITIITTAPGLTHPGPC